MILTDTIKTVKLTKYYGNKRGIVELDLTVPQGAFFGFIGPNGAGKSTTIRTLLGLISPSGGSASVFGKDIVKDKNEVLKSVGYLPSEAVFYHGMKVSEIIKLSADLRKADCKKEAALLCERLQLDTSRKVDDLSFGNRKKVAIVCALQHKPELLILDEPTGGLDPLMQKEFFDILRERNKEGTTVFLSSHVLSEIQRNCQTAAIIREGRIIACDRVEVLSKTSAKRVCVCGSIAVEKLPDVRDVKFSDEGVSFLYGGNIKKLLACLNEGSVTDFTVSEPDMEEIFMHYYADGGEEK